ncbi:hypothetical protein MRB53_014127 [Persea americana]|uniref:Uncharacterized protein n=1 Tax=Persea americana TaxID=3435 RepID=A0ACC2KA59_PERAE|nr:hypothetical protein MRB53_014127 [Persea americana]
MSCSRLALVRKEPTQEDFQLPTSQASEKKQDPLDIQPPSQAQLLPLSTPSSRSFRYTTTFSSTASSPRRPDGLDLEQGNLLERRQAATRRRWWRKFNALERWSRERRARSRGGHLLDAGGAETG